MATNTVTSENLGETMFEAAKSSLGSKFVLIKHFLKGESEKFAVTLRMIIEASANDDITKEDAKILLNMQKIAATAVLTAVEGMTAVAAQAAINAALKVVKDFVNGKLGFPLL